MLLSFSIRHTHDPVYAVAGAKIHHNTFVYNSRICGGGQVGTEGPAPPLRTSPHALRVNIELLRTSLALCALFQNCFALLYTHCALIPNCSALRAPAILRGIHTPACRPSCSCRVIPSNALHAASKLSHVRA